MNRAILILLFISLNLIINTQASSQSKIKYANQINVGMQINDIYTSSNDMQLYKKRMSYCISYARLINLKNNFNLNLGVGFSEKGANYDLYIADTVAKKLLFVENFNMIKLSYLEFPIIISKNIIDNKFSIGFGVSFNYLLKGQKRYPEYKNNGIVMHEKDINSKIDYPFKYSYFTLFDPQSLLSINYKIDKLHMQLSAKYLISIFQLNSLYRFRNSNFQLSYSYIF